MFGLFKKRRPKADVEFYDMLDKIFGFTPNNIEIYKLALVHRSMSQHIRPKGLNGRKVPIDNERLEFLGDAIIESVVSDYLFVQFPYESEGFLTKMRSRMVNRATLNELCIATGMSEHIRSSAHGGGVLRNINGDAFEAMIGAMYLDKGYDFTNKMLIKLLLKHISPEEVATTETDFKSSLIEWCQRGRHRLRFSTAFGEGSKRNAPTFRSVVYIDDMEVGFGMGGSKKEAEQHAAYTVSQALSDEMGDRLLTMIDNGMDRETAAVVAESMVDKPRKKRHRGGKKHKKPVQRTSDANPDEIVETSFDDGVVSVSIEKVEEVVVAEQPIAERPKRKYVRKTTVAKTEEKPAEEKKAPAKKPAAKKSAAPKKPATAKPKAAPKPEAPRLDTPEQEPTRAQKRTASEPKRKYVRKTPAAAKPKVAPAPAEEKPKRKYVRKTVKVE